MRFGKKLYYNRIIEMKGEGKEEIREGEFDGYISITLVQTYLIITPFLFSTGIAVRFSSVILSGRKTYFLSYMSFPR